MAISTASYSRVALAVQRTEDQLEGLVREHAGFVFRVAYSVLRNHHDAEDVTQETFLRVLRRRSELAAIQEPRAWLARIVFRIALNRYRSRRRQMDDPAEVLADLEAKGISM